MVTDLLRRLLATSSVTSVIEIDRDGILVEVNPAFARRARVAPEQLVGRSLFDFAADPEIERLRDWLGEGDPPREPVRLNFSQAQGPPFSLRCLVERAGPDSNGLRIVGEPETEDDRASAEVLMELNNELATVARERARRERELERTRAELESALADLQTSYWHLQKIQEVLPLCMSCGRVKAGEASWETLLDYLKANQIFMSHGYCPDCAEKVLREHGLDGESE